MAEAPKVQDPAALGETPKKTWADLSERDRHAMQLAIAQSNYHLSCYHVNLSSYDRKEHEKWRTIDLQDRHNFGLE